MSLKPIFKSRQCWCSSNVRRQTVHWATEKRGTMTTAVVSCRMVALDDDGSESLSLSLPLKRCVVEDRETGLMLTDDDDGQRRIVVNLKVNITLTHYLIVIVQLCVFWKVSSSCESLQMPRYSPVQSLLDLITAELDPSNVLSKSHQRLTGKNLCLIIAY